MDDKNNLRERKNHKNKFRENTCEKLYLQTSLHFLEVVIFCVKTIKTHFIDLRVHFSVYQLFHGLSKRPSQYFSFLIEPQAKQALCVVSKFHLFLFLGDDILALIHWRDRLYILYFIIVIAQSFGFVSHSTYDRLHLKMSTKFQSNFCVIINFISSCFLIL